MLRFIKEIWRGKDIYRIFMNEECKRYTLRGHVLDIGSGLNLASYHRFLRKEAGISLECLDLGFEGNKGKRIDLETDTLPYEDASVDIVLLFNLLEHIYNYPLVLSEIKRLLKSKGELIGVVPFLVTYHPDPHDYWRYTRETLEKIFAEAGFANIVLRSFGYGPGVAAFSQIESVLPRIVKILILPSVLLFDWMVIKLRPKMNREKFPLGIFFHVTR